MHAADIRLEGPNPPLPSFPLVGGVEPMVGNTMMVIRFDGNVSGYSCLSELIINNN